MTLPGTYDAPRWRDWQEKTRRSARRKVPVRAFPYINRKLISIVAWTFTGWPLRNPGLNFHCRAQREPPVYI